MEKAPLKLNSKVRLKLIQPQIKCHERDDVVAYFRGKVVAMHYSGVQHCEYYAIEFKYKGESICASYNYTKDEFIREELKDIKIVG